MPDDEKISPPLERRWVEVHPHRWVRADGVTDIAVVPHPDVIKTDFHVQIVAAGQVLVFAEEVDEHCAGMLAVMLFDELATGTEHWISGNRFQNERQYTEWRGLHLDINPVGGRT